MAHAFCMDVHAPSAITEGLRRRGVDVLTCQEDDAAHMADEALLQRATDLQRILFSQDRDFLSIASEWQRQGHRFAGVVYAHQLGPGRGAVIEDLELIAFCAEKDELQDRVIILAASMTAGGFMDVGGTAARGLSPATDFLVDNY